MITIIIVVAVFVIYQVFLKKEKPEFSLFEVKRDNVVQEVSETGQVQMGEEIKLGFKNAGTIEKIYVKVGDKVEAGTALAKLETSELTIQLYEAQAVLEIAQAKLNKLLAGSTPEEIQFAETTLKNAKQDLLDTEADATEDLKQAYEDAKATLDGSYEKGSSALTTVNSIQKTYFISNDQESITVKNEKDKIETALSEAKEYIDAAKADRTAVKIDRALSELKSALENIYNDLVVIRNVTETINYKNVVTVTDKTSLDTAKTNVNTGLTNVINAQQTIASTKLTNESNINTAKGAVKEAEDELALKKAEPRQEDIDLYQAQVKQAKAQAQLLENKIWEATLRSPTNGRVTKVGKRVGEMVQPVLAESVISLLPASPFEIKADIYEEDIVKIEVGNLVDINLVALPEQIFKGRVISINPAEKIKNEIIYYEATVSFEEAPAGIKPGMTADLVIKSASKENVLVLPKEAIQKKDSKTVAQVLKNNRIEDREIEIGLEGSDNMVEIISGLDEGEKVIIK